MLCTNGTDGKGHGPEGMIPSRFFLQMGGFGKSSQGEGARLIQDRTNGIVETDIRDCMICVAHDGNTVDKNQFNTDHNQTGIEYDGDRKDILKQILNL